MQHILVGTTSPQNVPARLGQHYVDTVSGTVYMSAGTSSISDWKPSTSLSNEQIQDVVGAMFTSSGGITFFYNDALNQIVISLDQSQINHNNLLNVGSNTHSQIDAHIASNSNPHSVTKAQVGLGSADNTSDINKPISTATQVALNAKVDKTTTISAGAGLTGGGDLSANRVISLEDSGALAGQYKRPVFTIDSKGRIVSIRERVIGYNESNSTASSNVSTMSSYLALTINSVVDSEYKLNWSALFRHNTNANSPKIDIFLNGTSIYGSNFGSFEELSDTATSEQNRRSGFKKLNLLSGNNIVEIMFGPESSGSTMTMLSGELLMEEL